MFGFNHPKPSTSRATTDDPKPKDLDESLKLLGESFFTARMRNLDIMDSSQQPLYGFMTHYCGGNYCWIQPTRTFCRTADFEYSEYIKNINHKGRHFGLDELQEFKVGENCVACYEADKHWYRGMIIGEQVNEKWLVLFIDYGNVQRTDKYNIKRPIVDKDFDHFRVPMQAVCCRLYNVIPKHPDRSQIDLHFERFFAEHSEDFLELIVKDVKTDYIVDCDVFLTKKATKGVNRLYKKHIAQKVVTLGLASFADPDAACAIPKQSQVEEIVIDDEEEEMEEQEEDKKPNIKVETIIKSETPIKSEPKFKPKAETTIFPKVEKRFNPFL